MSTLAVAVQGTNGIEGTPDLFVIFRVGDAEYAVESAVVLQMEAFTGATAVPGTAPFIVGVMPIRGRVVPVIDLRVRFGLEAAARSLDSRVVVGQLGDRAVALLADSAREVLRIAGTALKPPPPMIDSASLGFIKAIAQVNGRLILLLDFAKVIGEESTNVR
jgi:purine-binding chemotaxis protein CheW